MREKGLHLSALFEEKRILNFGECGNDPSFKCNFVIFIDIKISKN